MILFLLFGYLASITEILIAVICSIALRWYNNHWFLLVQITLTLICFFSFLPGASKEFILMSCVWPGSWKTGGEVKDTTTGILFKRMSFSVYVCMHWSERAISILPWRGRSNVLHGDMSFAQLHQSDSSSIFMGCSSSRYEYIPATCTWVTQNNCHHGLFITETWNLAQHT